MNAQLVSDVLAELAVRGVQLGAKSNELAITSLWQRHRRAIESLNYRHSYNDCDMICGDPARGPDLPLPPGAICSNPIFAPVC